MQFEFPIDIETYPFKEKTPIQMRFNDLDGFAHVNNAVLQSYFDIGRSTYLQHIYGDNFYTNEKGLFIASYKTDFIKQITLEDHIEVRSSIYKLGTKSLKMIQVIYDVARKRPCTVSDVVMVAVELTNRTSIAIPQEWREKIMEIEGREL